MYSPIPPVSLALPTISLPCISMHFPVLNLHLNWIVYLAAFCVWHLVYSLMISWFSMLLCILVLHSFIRLASITHMSTHVILLPFILLCESTISTLGLSWIMWLFVLTILKLVGLLACQESHSHYKWDFSDHCNHDYFCPFVSLFSLYTCWCIWWYPGSFIFVSQAWWYPEEIILFLAILICNWNALWNLRCGGRVLCFSATKFPFGSSCMF